MFVRSRIAVTHRDPLIRAGLGATLQACADFEVHTVPAEPAPAQRRRLEKMDVVLADCEDGIRLAQTEKSSARRVLIVTRDDSEANIRLAVNAGVRGYLLLGSTLESIIQAVRTVARGGSAIDPVAATRIVESLTAEKLTPRELDVLALLTRGMRNKSIAKHLGITPGTAKTHVKHVLTKLHAASRTEAVFIGQRRGLLPSVPLHSPPPAGADTGKFRNVCPNPSRTC
jgi:DNA-binding NarL/FixJ family response regulator